MNDLCEYEDVIEEKNHVICPICGKKAHNIDDITVWFGYKKIKEGLVPEKICKECRDKSKIMGGQEYVKMENTF